MGDLLPATVSALEVVRALVAAFGLCVSWSGWALAKRRRALISDAATDDAHVRRSREQQDGRMALFTEAQRSFCLVHAMLLGNALIQMAYPSAPIEQFNVLMGNVTQVMIPLILARVSEAISAQMRTVARLDAVTGPRDPDKESAP